MTAMTAFPLGETSALSVAEQSAFLTAASSGFKSLNYYSAPFSKTQPPAKDRTLGAGYNNAVDARAPGPGLVNGTGKIDAPMSLSQLGWYLKAALGYGSSSGSTGAYTHPFASGSSTLPVFTIEQMKAAGLYDVAFGVYCKQLQLAIKAGSEGWAHVMADFGVADILQSQSSSIAGSPTAYTSEKNIAAWQGKLNIGGSQVGSLIDTTFTLVNSFVEDRYADVNTLAAMGLDGQEATIEATVRYTTDAIRTSGVVDATTGLPTVDTGVSIVWTNSSTKKLTITPVAVRFEPMDTPVEGPGALQVKLKGTCEQTAGAAMLAATLLNAQASY